MSTLSALQQGTSGSENTVREILQQPDVWKEAAENFRAQQPEIDAFLTPLLARNDVRIILTGAGTSAFAGDTAVAAIARHTGRRVDAISTTTIVATPREVFAEDVPTILVSFARSGNSPESVAATRLANELLSSVHHVVLTCDPAGRLFTQHDQQPNSRIVVMPERANDQGFAMTSSFTSMLLTCLLAFHVEDGTIVDALAEAATSVIGHRADDIFELAQQGFERVVYLGSGALAGLAHESALKLLELTAGEVVTYFDTPLGFRHGPKAVLDTTTLAVVYVSSDPHTRLYDLDIVHELRASIGNDHVIAVASAPIPHSAGPVWLLPGLEGVTDAVAAVAYVVVAQLIGLSFALARGTTPDNPFPGNEVNRVVQGVTIHSLTAPPTDENDGGKL